MRRAPRLSARLLQRFRFAAQQAKAVEYHRERLDGSGYYGAQGSDIPLAAHFLILADAFDAMTSERPFRPALSDEDALAEIERNAGTQFHPALAKAFAAVKRGLSPDAVLAEDELAAIRGSSERSPVRPGVAELGHRPELIVAVGATLGLVGLGIGLTELAAAGAAIGVLGALRWLMTRVRAHRLAAAIDDAVSTADRPRVFGRVVDAFAAAWPLEYAILVAWEENGTDGSIELERGESTIPEPELTSWLLREAESSADLIADDGSQLGRAGSSLALPLRRENTALVGFLVLGGSGHPPAHVVTAARASLDPLGLALAPAPLAPGERHLVAVN
jgi:hypothetical protein